MKALILTLALFSLTAKANLVELETADELNDLIQSSNVPLVVQFAAEWCGPCQQLKSVFRSVAPSYDDSRVKIIYIDADKNRALRKYLQGGYPTVRTFSHGKLASPAFVGSNSSSFVRRFLDDATKLRAEINFCPVQD